MGLTKFSFDFNRSSPTATEVYQIPLSQCIAEARAYVGGVQMVGGVLQYIPAAVQPDTGLICLGASVSCDFVGQSAPIPIRDNDGIVEMTVTYGVPEIEQDSDSIEFGSLSMDLGGEMLQLEKGQFTWVDSGEKLKDEDVKPFKFVGEGSVTVKFPFKTQVDPEALSAFNGNVNSAPLKLPTGMVAAGFARFDGAQLDRKYSTDAFQYYEMNYKFSIGSHNWNHLWNGSAYAAVEPLIYPTTDLNGVFSA